VTAPEGARQPPAPSGGATATGGAAAGAVLLLPTVQAQARARQAITDTLFRQVQAILRGFTQWYDDKAVARMSAQVGILVGASQRLAATSTNSYLSRAASQMTDRTFRPTSTPDLTDLRTGVAPADVYERLARQYRYELSPAYLHPPAPLPERLNKTPEAVLDDVVDRAEVMVDLDVTRAVQVQSQWWMDHQDGVTGYRRVLHPELSQTGACGLCIAASDRVYKKSDLMPIHARCHCETLPIIRGQDPAGVLNDLDLKRLYKDAGNTTDQRALKKQRYSVNEHGELGPVLTAKGDAFRSPADVAAV
jgi:hypothetical protein